MPNNSKVQILTKYRSFLPFLFFYLPLPSNVNVIGKEWEFHGPILPTVVTAVACCSNTIINCICVKQIRYPCALKTNLKAAVTKEMHFSIHICIFVLNFTTPLHKIISFQLSLWILPIPREKICKTFDEQPQRKTEQCCRR